MRETYPWGFTPESHLLWGPLPGAAVSTSVLIVDDDATIRRLLKYVLELEGYVVIGEASDGVDAVQRAEALKPDVVVMNHMLPLQDGIAATREIKRRMPDAAVVGFATSDDPRVARAMREAGASCYATKDDIGGLLECLRAAIQG
jgi:two-component system, NarL family, response regulator LiaR